MVVKTDLEIFFEEIKKDFVTSQIMTDTNNFVYHKGSTDRNTKDFDILPEENLKKYWSKSDKKIHPIVPEDIISSNLDLLTLLDCFEDKNFYFIKDGKKIGGMVHYSDLKKHPMRVLFYILISHLELKFQRYYDKKIDFVRDALGKTKSEEIDKQILEDKNKNQDLKFLEYLSFTNFLKVIAKDEEILKKLKIKNSKKFHERFNSLIEFRNWVAHPVRKEIKTEKKLKDFLLEQKKKIMILDKAFETKLNP